MELQHKNVKLILASGSPRRQQFLRDLGLPFEIRLREVNEVYPPGLQAAQITDYLAQLKADAFAGELAPEEILITSDTIVWHDERAIGKPADYDDAVAMLSNLSGQTHSVFTSICLRSKHRNVVFHDETKVTFGALSDGQIRHYLDTARPFDKAGAYGIQDWIGLVAISRIEGSYTNVVGLPTEKFYSRLKQFIDDL